MLIKTVQNKQVVDIVNTEGLYIADYTKIRYPEYIQQYEKLSAYCDFENCPIFCVPADHDDAISASGLSKDDDNVIIVLNVDDEQYRIMDYYDFSTYLYYSSGQEYDSFFNWDAENALENIDSYIKLGMFSDTPQVVIDRIRKEDVVEIE